MDKKIKAEQLTDHVGRQPHSNFYEGFLGFVHNDQRKITKKRQKIKKTQISFVIINGTWKSVNIF